MAVDLDRTVLFKDLALPDQWKLKSICAKETYHKGQFIFRRGEPAGPLYIVCDGQVRVSVEANGGEEVIAMVEEGQHVGEMSFLEKTPRSANAIANTDPTLLAVVDDSKLRKLMEDNEMVEYRILRVFTDTLLPRLQSTSQQFASTLIMALADTNMHASEAVLSQGSFDCPDDAASIIARGEDLRDAAIVDKALASEILWLILPRLSRRLREIDRRLRIAKEL